MSSSNIAADYAIRNARVLATIGQLAHAAATIDALLDCYPSTDGTAVSVEFLLGGDTYDCLGAAWGALVGDCDPEELAEDGLTPVNYAIECLTEALALLVD